MFIHTYYLKYKETLWDSQLLQLYLTKILVTQKLVKLLLSSPQFGPMGQLSITETYLMRKAGTANLLMLCHANFPHIMHKLAWEREIIQSVLQCISLVVLQMPKESSRKKANWKTDYSTHASKLKEEPKV